MTEMENDLRTWMQERAARVHASSEILATDYRPRAHSWRPRLAIGGALAAIAGTANAVLSLAGGRARRSPAGAPSRPPLALRSWQRRTPIERQHPESKPPATAGG